MANDAWFESNPPHVEGFDSPECPHGFLRFEMQHNLTDATYRCTNCGAVFVSKIQVENEED